MNSIKLIVGLGNPGQKYSFTRHNMGFMVLDWFMEYIKHSREDCVRIKAESRDLILWEWASTAEHSARYLLKPLTFMNRSGPAVARTSFHLRLDPDQVLIVHDEVDLPLGRLKLKFGGGLAGHKGLRSIAGELGTNDFARLRMGIGRPLDESPLSSYVLRKFSPEEYQELERCLDRAVFALRLVCREGLDKAFREINTV